MVSLPLAVVFGLIFPFEQLIVLGWSSNDTADSIPRILTCLYGACVVAIVSLVPAVKKGTKEKDTFRASLITLFEHLPPVCFEGGVRVIMQELERRLKVSVWRRKLFDILTDRTNTDVAAGILTYVEGDEPRA